MRKIGLIGGLSWFSTRTYYEYINRGVQARAGATASAPMVIESLDAASLMRLSSAEDWQHASDVLAESARRLEAAGATAILIGANSMHKVYDAVADAVAVPLLHIAECVAERMVRQGAKRAALLGTRNVMLDTFYRQKLIARDIELLPPSLARVETLDRIIYDELMLGKATRQSERELKTIITTLGQEGAEAIVLGCTELEMIVDVDANVLPIFDCTRIHADAAVDWILGEG
ncbi:aspartate/glutamate racemase family protein [Novosphingobium album (ex Liu et al. 2023)]|uniref:Amino acid racemase n=1 Tax=Novosphingobium album (ex Liu et al. 2023) TaxID=3031130 RepID=A0ABT5WW36_9SPHN|nr:amino acid racemase [Novosphingobium album (ex Liu et al. 2023)]MDE8654086.1 amino acid racemase [Novosphingobium album (ex Liu et al. 2023)]